MLKSSFCQVLQECVKFDVTLKFIPKRMLEKTIQGRTKSNISDRASQWNV